MDQQSELNFDVGFEFDYDIGGDLDLNINVAIERTIDIDASITIDTDISGNVAELMLCVDAYGENTFVAVESAVLIVENQLSSVWVYARAVSAEDNQNEYPVAFSVPADSNGAANIVGEGAAGDTPVGITASAFDADDSKIIYSLVTDAAGAIVLADGPFKIDPTSGVVSVRDGSLLDYESAPSETIYVKAASSDGSSAVQSFTAEIGNVNEAPRGTIAISSSTQTVETTVTRPLEASDLTNPAIQFLNPNNNHVYEFVNTDVRWDQALTLASASNLAGVQGHLVTITSAAEQAFVVSHMGLITVGWNGDDIWIAASDATTEGTWKWMAGPELGTAVAFSDWAWGGPSNFRVGSDYGTLTDTPYYDTSGAWLDLDQEWFLGGSRTWENSSNYSRTYRGNGHAIEYSGNVTETVSTEIQTLTADTSHIADPDGLGAFSYQWQRLGDSSWVDIAGATADSYRASHQDAGRQVRVEISYVDGGGTLERLISGPSAIPSPPPPPPPPAPPLPSGAFEFNGHFYQIVESIHVTRDAAVNAAAGTFTRQGATYQGHLLTVGSAAEETAIENAILGTNNGNYFTSLASGYWLGGEYRNGRWEWSQGPEAGQPLTYSDWGGIEQTQGIPEPYLVLNMFSRPDINGVWYSYTSDLTHYMRGYVVEYEPLM
jgi:hypothetical protein